MCYKNGKDILPENLLKELQKYVQGEILYIPKEEHCRKAWGEISGGRKIINERNQEICKYYKNGTPIIELSESYNLSEDSIRKIIFNKCNRNIAQVSLNIGDDNYL